MLRNLQLLDQIERLEAEKKHEKHENPLTLLVTFLP